MPPRLPPRAGLLALACLWAGGHRAEGQGAGADEPACAPFWAAEELPAVHQLDLTVAQADFDAMSANQMDRTRKVTGALAFNDAAYEGVEVKVHGGQYQRHGVDKLPAQSEKDAKLAQKLGQLQPFLAEFPQECAGQLASFGPT